MSKIYVDRPDSPISAHAASHKSAGSDPIKLDELAAPTDVTTLNASASAHGLLKKLSNVASQFLNGAGSWASVAWGDITGKPTTFAPATHGSQHASGGNDPLDTGAPTDMVPYATFVGWASYTTRVLSFLKIGKLALIQFHISGTSNSATTTVSLPFIVATGLDQFGMHYAVDNGGAPAVARNQVTGSTLYLSPTLTLSWTQWTASGTKTVRGHLFYFTS